jgi:hypothetical protein
MKKKRGRIRWREYGGEGEGENWEGEDDGDEKERGSKWHSRRSLWSVSCPSNSSAAENWWPDGNEKKK